MHWGRVESGERRLGMLGWNMLCEVLIFRSDVHVLAFYNGDLDIYSFLSTLTPRTKKSQT